MAIWVLLLLAPWNFFTESVVICIYAAEVPHLINYQGRLLQGGKPVNGNKNITFKICSSEQGGEIHWSETQNNVPITNGIFNVLLGSVNPIPTIVFSSDSETNGIWLETYLKDDETSLGRQRMVSVGYAFKAEDTDKLDNKDSTDFLDTSATAQTKSGSLNLGSNLTVGGKFGFGIASPGYPFQVEGTVANYLAYVNNPSLNGYGLLLDAGANDNTHQTVRFRNYAGSERWTLAGNGNVGQGTLTPTSTVGYAGPLYHLYGFQPAIIMQNKGGTENMWEIGTNWDNNSGKLTLGSGGKYWFTIRDNGNVGIGTDPYYYKFQVQDNAINYVTYIRNLNTSTDSSGVLIDAGNGTGGASLRVRSGPGAEYFYVRGDGNVGIGTTEPRAALHVVSNDASADTAIFSQSHTSNEAILTINSPTDNVLRQSRIYLKRANNLKWSIGGVYNIEGFHIGTDGLTPAAQKFSILENGNVGIGTTNPGDYRLNVSGNQYVSGNLNIGGKISGDGSGLTNIGVGAHNHDTTYVNEGQASSINSSMITDASIATADIADGAVTDAKVASIATSKLSGTIGTSQIADGTVTSAKIVDGTIINTDVDANAAISGTKVNPDFGSQNIKTTGNIAVEGGINTGGFFPSPAYDSGWFEVSPGANIVLNHNLNYDKEKIYVELTGRDAVYYHGMLLGYVIAWWNSGISWRNLSETSLTVYRDANDINWNQIRIRIWKLS